MSKAGKSRFWRGIEGACVGGGIALLGLWAALYYELWHVEQGWRVPAHIGFLTLLATLFWLYQIALDRGGDSAD